MKDITGQWDEETWAALRRQMELEAVMMPYIDRDPMEPNYERLGRERLTTANADSRDSAETPNVQ